MPKIMKNIFDVASVYQKLHSGYVFKADLVCNVCMVTRVTLYRIFLKTLSIVTGKSFNGKCIEKMIQFDRVFYMLPLMMLTSEVSPYHYLTRSGVGLPGQIKDSDRSLP